MGYQEKKQIVLDELEKRIPKFVEYGLIEKFDTNAIKRYDL